VLYNLAETLRIVAILLSPAMPTTAEKIWNQLGIATKLSDVRLSDGAAVFGGLVVGTKVNKPEQIFPRIDEQEVIDEGTAEVPVAEIPKFESLPEVSIDDFAKMDLRVAKVLAAEKVLKADKLLKLEVDLGGEVRTIVSGIAKHYVPEDLVGQSVLMIVNLKSATIRGIESRGMVLAASADGKLAVVAVPDMPAGSKVK